MAHHKRRRAKQRRAGCLLCKPWKHPGVALSAAEAERHADHRRRSAAGLDLQYALAELRSDREI